MWAAKIFQLHHDNAPTHTTNVIQAFLVKNNISLVTQVPYSPFRSGRSAGKSVRTTKGNILKKIEQILKIHCVVCFIQKSRILFKRPSY